MIPKKVYMLNYPEMDKILRLKYSEHSKVYIDEDAKVYKPILDSYIGQAIMIGVDEEGFYSLFNTSRSYYYEKVKIQLFDTEYDAATELIKIADQKIADLKRLKKKTLKEYTVKIR